MTPVVLARQIRSARAWLDWSREDLAARAGVAPNTLATIEKGDGASEPNARTLAKILQALELGGVSLTKKGIEEKEEVITIIEGDDWYGRLLDDVYGHLAGRKNAELIIMCADDRVSPPAINAQYRRLRAAGIRMRQLVQEGNLYLMGALDEYRYMPRERFNNYVSLIYGDKLAICTDNNTKALVFHDPLLAKTWTNLFEVLWAVLKQPETSTADERF